MIARAVFVTIVLFAQTTCAQDLMGPGSMQQYKGGGGGQRRVGYVREPAEGFFVAGSTIRDMNGVYKKVEQVPLGLRDVIHLAYRKWPADQQDTFTGWHLCLVKSPEPGTVPWKPVGNKASEWVFIDPSRNERFGHEGDTVIPGAGTAWKHLHRSVQEGEKATGQVAAPDDEDELPWQVIFIGSAQMVEDLRHSELHRERAVHHAIGNGYSCRDREHGCEQEEPQHGLYEMPDVDALLEEGKYEEALEVYSKALSQGGQDRNWKEAQLRRGIGRCLRKARNFVKALDEIGTALRIKPMYKEAIFELALTLLDAGRPAIAVSAFERLLQLDRTWPRISYWITLAHSNQKRSQDKLETLPLTHGPSGIPQKRTELYRSESQRELDVLVSQAIRRAGYAENSVVHGIDHYATLEIGVDHTAEELKRAYKIASRRAHPDKNGGSNVAFQAVAAAYETLSDPNKRALYDEGDDIKREIREDGSEGRSWSEQVLRAYFPENYPFEPFGDPYERKKLLAEERRLNTPPEPNGEGIPAGAYLTSCKGCSIVPGKASTDSWLRCTHCLTGQGNKFDETSIKVGSCHSDEQIINHYGVLMCEKLPGGAQIEAGPDDAGAIHSESHRDNTEL